LACFGDRGMEGGDEGEVGILRTAFEEGDDGQGEGCREEEVEVEAAEMARRCRR
jgi:hypothetical protein